MDHSLDQTVLGFDIGGTWLRVAEVDRSGAVIWEDRVTPAREYPADIELLQHMIRPRSSNVVAAAIACPGPLDFRTGKVLKAANLNWIDVFPGNDLAPTLGVPVVVENDADCAALAEATYGAGMTSSLVVWYGLGTGVGAGVVVDDKIFHGTFDPEFGHQMLEPDSHRFCTAGHRGCLEALISGNGLEMEFGSIEQVPIEQWHQIVPRYLGQALANATLFFSPDAIVVGGGVVDHRPDIVGPAIDFMREMLGTFVTPPEVTQSALGRDVGILGAAAAAWQLCEGLVPIP
jgi:predicted NBD/HSP70 family sugar kinase